MKDEGFVIVIFDFSFVIFHYAIFVLHPISVCHLRIPKYAN